LVFRRIGEIPFKIKSEFDIEVDSMNNAFLCCMIAFKHVLLAFEMKKKEFMSVKGLLVDIVFRSFEV